MHSFYRGESRPGQDHPDQSLSAADQERQRGVQPRPPTSRPGLQAPAALITDGRSWPKGPPCPCPAGRDETRPRNRKVLREPFPSPQRPGLAQSLPPTQAQSKKNQFQEAAPGLQAAFRPDCNSARGGPGPQCPAWGPWAKPEGLASVCRLNCRPPDPSWLPPHTIISSEPVFPPGRNNTKGRPHFIGLPRYCISHNVQSFAAALCQTSPSLPFFQNHLLTSCLLATFW